MYSPRTSSWLRLDEETRRRLLDRAIRELARRSFTGSMIYFGTIAAVPFASPVLREHPMFTILALASTFAAGLTRIAAARHLMRTPSPEGFWVRTFETAVLATVAPWGAFCALTLFLYGDAWPSIYLLIAGAALSGGAITALAPHLWLGTWALLLLILPSGICGFLLGTAGSRVLAVSACVYLAYLLAQLSLTSKAYWKAATTPALDAMLSRRAASWSEGRFQTLFEDAPSGIYLASRDGKLEMANGALAQMLGYSGADQVAGRNLKTFSPDSDLELMAAAIEERGSVTGWESDWRRSDGTQIRVRESVRAVHSGADSPFSLLGIVEDVTERFAADQARRQLVEILESTSDLVERIAATGETLYLNRASRKLLNATKEREDRDVGGRASPESVWNRAGDEELRRDRLRSADEEGIWQGESWLHGADGKPIPVSQVIISHRSSDGSTNSYSIISRDISAMREAQEALRETGEQLFQAQRLESLGRLAGGIAHDFNNLLTVIMGHASVLEPAMQDTRYREGIAAISSASARAADLTRQLLAFGRKQVLSRGIVDVKEVVRGAERLLRRLIGARIELILRLTEEPQTVISDAAQLEQVLVNLILNARDAMPRGGLATIETSIVPGDEESENGTSAREYVRISVSDTGIGMDEHTMTRVFEPFFTTKGSGNGTGLGLATAHGFIRQSGGSITVSSRPGVGSTFVILLPRSTAAVAEESDEEELSDAGHDERVLVVDDEPAVRGLLRQTLAGRGYLVTEARDAEEALALALASEEEFDLLITDVVMPGLTGPQLARHLTEMFPRLAVLFISGYPGETRSERAAFGARAGYLPKPFTAEMLLRYARRQLERGRERTRHAGQ